MAHIKAPILVTPIETHIIENPTAGTADRAPDERAGREVIGIEIGAIGIVLDIGVCVRLTVLPLCAVW